MVRTAHPTFCAAVSAGCKVRRAHDFGLKSCCHFALKRHCISFTDIAPNTTYMACPRYNRCSRTASWPGEREAAVANIVHRCLHAFQRQQPDRRAVIGFVLGGTDRDITDGIGVATVLIPCWLSPTITCGFTALFCKPKWCGNSSSVERPSALFTMVMNAFRLPTSRQFLIAPVHMPTICR